MKHYVGLDEHSNNVVIGMIDENAKKVLRKKLPNDIAVIKETIKPFKKTINGIVVESTFNWYWLVDGLMQVGYKLHLANTSAIKQYEGLKHTNDFDDAFHLANLLRLGILPEGYIYPKKQRAIRDLLRKRSIFVRQRTANILSFQNIYTRNTGHKIRCNEIKTMPVETLKALYSQKHIYLSARATLLLIHYLTEQIKMLEKEVLQSIKLAPEFQKLRTVAGIGTVLSLIISLETGEIKRFENVGNYSSYCRCVQSVRISNEKKKGENNRKNGNKYLAWAFVEAAHFAIQHYPEVRKFYQRKLASSKNVVAIKATAHKLARAAYFVMRDKVDFSMEKAFGVIKNKVAAENH